MSFAPSIDLNTGIFVATSLYSVYGVAAQYNTSDIYFSHSAGQSWALSTNNDGASGSGWVASYISSTGWGVIVSATGSGIYYTESSGTNWSVSNNNPTNVHFSSVYMSSDGQYGVAGSINNLGLYYTSNNGYVWTQSTSGAQHSYNSVSMSADGSIAIAGSASDLGVYYSSNSGQTWTRPSITSGYFFSVALASSATTSGGRYGIAGSSSNTGFYYTSDVASSSWSNPISTGDFSSVAISSTGQYAIAGSASGFGIYYTNDYGSSWTQVNGSNGSSFYSVSMDLTGQYAVAGSSTGAGIWYTGNYGSSWTQQYSGSSFESVSVYSANGIGNAIAGSESNLGVYYTSTPLCFEKNVEILCLIDGVEQYVKVCEITIDMLVKTYKQGYKKVTNMKKFNYNPLNKNDELECLYKMKDNNIIVTGGHSILEDELSEKQKNNKFNFHETIEDKHLVLACLSDKFEKITENNGYELCHIVLENENKNGHYGIYITNDILSESCPENIFNTRFK